jgi:predicted amidohydrolase
MDIRDSIDKPLVLRYKVAAIQYESKIFQREKNVADLLRLTEEAANNDAKIIVMPEMATTGICFYDRQEVSNLVEPVPGPTSEAFGKIASKYGCYIAYGEAEVNPLTDAYYNSSVFIGPKGVVGVYRKTHLFLSEPKWSKGGDLGIPAWETEFGTVGMIICHDAAFPETSRVAALQGIDVMCFPTNWLERSPSGYWFTRAFDNGIYWIAANRYGIERGTQFSGNSSIIAPDGTLLATRDSGDGIIYAEVDLELAHKKAFPGEGELSKFTQRRPDAYKSITLDPYLWNPNLFFGLYGHKPLPAGCKFNVAVVQMRPTPGDIAGNRALIESMLIRERARSAHLIVFPELATSGLVGNSREAMLPMAEPIPGPTLTALTVHCRETGQYVVIGIAEREGEDLYNTAVLVGPDGVIGKHRQLHLDRRGIMWALPGNLPLTTFDIKIGRIGLLVGHDLNFPESTRLLALEAADLVCIPSALTFPQPVGVGPTEIPYPPGVNTKADPQHWILWRQRATDDSTYIAVANQYGPIGDDNFLGLSGIFTPGAIYGPRNEVISPSDGESIVAMDLDTTNTDRLWPTNPVRLKEFLALRQPEWYVLCQVDRPPVIGAGK